MQAWAEAGNLFNERERAALAWAETVTRVAETGVPEDAYQAMRAVFEEKELVDLTIAISLMNVYNRFGYRLPEHNTGGAREVTHGAPVEAGSRLHSRISITPEWEVKY